MQVAGEGTGYLSEGFNKGLSLTLDITILLNSEEIMKAKGESPPIQSCTLSHSQAADMHPPLQGRNGCPCCP
jgi:hypothetical protein